MADRYQDRPFPAEHDYSGEHDHGLPPGKAESDPLAELARLIGQTDPFGGANKAPHPLQSRANVRPQTYQPPEQEFTPPSPPPWMQRARQEVPPPQEPEYVEPEQAEQDLQPSLVHPLHRYTAQHAEPAPEPEYREDLPFPEAGQEPDPSRYDDALYGKIESGEQDFQRDPAYPDDPYAYQGGYEEDEPAPRKRSSGLMTVAAVLALAVVGTGGALAYRTYVGSPRTGEPPIIKADNSPTKVMASPADGVAAKTPDRMLPGDGGEKLVSREETPVDVNSRAGGPRVVFPPLNQNASPPTVASVTPQAALSPATANGNLPNTEPRKVSTLRVKGDAADAGVPAGAAPPSAKPAPAARTAVNPAPARGNPSAANASANAPLSLTPGAAPPDPAPTRVASTNPAPAASGGSGWLVQVSSQKSEADAQASYRALQGKYPGVLGSQSSTVKRVDLSDKGHGIVYRAFAGPFGSADQATQVCNSLKAAGGPLCLIQRN